MNGRVPLFALSPGLQSTDTVGKRIWQWHRQKINLSDRSVCVYSIRVMVRGPLNSLFDRVFTVPQP